MNVWRDLFVGRAANFLTAFVNILLLVFNCNSIEHKPVSLDLKDYSLVFEDDFNGSELNKKYWRSHNAEGIRKGGYWSLNQVNVSNGNLKIRTEYKSDGAFGAGWYTAGISTKGKVERKYGYYECRCILPRGQGLWSAFWLTNNNVNQVLNDSSKGNEIDIFESPFYHLNNKNSWKVTSNLHYNGYGLYTKYKNVCIAEIDNNPYVFYNRYGLLWTEEEYIFYINGKEIAKTSYDGVSRENEYMILSCEVDGAAATPTFGWSGNIERNDKNNFFADFVVDYVRIYEKIK